MIEVLIQYIRDKGFIVDIIPAFEQHPGVLMIRKYAGKELCSVSWCIPKQDLRPELEEYLHDVADHYMDMIDTGIAEKVSA
jgi:hypothetical protein